MVRSVDVNADALVYARPAASVARLRRAALAAGARRSDRASGIAAHPRRPSTRTYGPRWATFGLAASIPLKKPAALPFGRRAAGERETSRPVGNAFTVHGNLTSRQGYPGWRCERGMRRGFQVSAIDGMVGIAEQHSRPSDVRRCGRVKRASDGGAVGSRGRCVRG